MHNKKERERRGGHEKYLLLINIDLVKIIMDATV